MMQCSICKGFFNPAMLSQVVEHQHNGMTLDKEYYGRKVDGNDGRERHAQGERSTPSE